MMNTIGYFEIQSSKPQRELEFYKNVFGWDFEKADSFPIEYYRIETENLSGGLLKRPSETPPIGYGTNAFTCSIIVEDFDQIEELILKNGGQVALPKFAVSGKCWQGYFLDTDNNTFGIVQADNNAQ